jgi:Mn2+/Fe2+ NRAMP family transporter
LIETRRNGFHDPRRIARRHRQLALTVAVGYYVSGLMPHRIYLQSALTQDQAPTDTGRQQHLPRLHLEDVLSAMSAARLVNVLMLVAAVAAEQSRPGCDQHTAQDALAAYGFEMATQIDHVGAADDRAATAAPPPPSPCKGC